MDHPDGQRILEYLQVVNGQRDLRCLTPGLQDRAEAIKRFQHARFQRTYEDLARQSRYALATRFFLDELYGPGDYGPRDAQFARIVPKLVNLFPASVVATVRDLAELHALTESLDTRMAQGLASSQISRLDYVTAWQQTGSPEARARQIDLVVAIGRDLDEFTRKPLLMTSLKMMRGPARAAGLSDLQRFLEAGLTAFREMRGAGEFLACIALRERNLCERLFDPQAPGALAAPGASGEAGLPGQDPLGQLPLAAPH